MIINKYKSHPWHGVDIGPDAPEIVTAYIEITPSDTVKYELDKTTGILKVDRPQLYSNVVPALYGFIPRTYCKEHVAQLCSKQTGLEEMEGDGDPLDILVLTEHRILQGNVLVRAIPIGGLKMIDDRQVDDKIVAVLVQDGTYSKWRDMFELPESIITRLKHYFLTYKLAPDTTSTVDIPLIYGKKEAIEVIEAAVKDYDHYFG